MYLILDRKRKIVLLDELMRDFCLQVFGSSRSKFRGLPHPEHFYEGILDCISKIYKRTGIRGLYRGVGMYLFISDIFLPQIFANLLCIT